MTATAQQTFTVTYEQFVRLKSLHHRVQLLANEAYELEQQIDYAIWSIHAERTRDDQPWLDQFDIDADTRAAAEATVRTNQGRALFDPAALAAQAADAS